MKYRGECHLKYIRMSCAYCGMVFHIFLVVRIKFRHFSNQNPEGVTYFEPRVLARGGEDVTMLIDTCN
jgi:hypothetical protein